MLADWNSHAIAGGGVASTASTRRQRRLGGALAGWTDAEADLVKLVDPKEWAKSGSAAVQAWRGMPLTAQRLQELLPKLDAAVGRANTCVIGNWMGGAPPASLADQIEESNAGWWTKNSLVGYVAAWMGMQWGGGHIWSIEDSCPGGPPIDQALQKLFVADPVLFDEVMGRGQAHRDDVAQQLERTGDEAAAKVFRYPLQKLADVGEGAQGLIDLVTGIVRNAATFLVIGGIGYGGYRYYRASKRGTAA
jgi:hypothetical protein